MEGPVIRLAERAIALDEMLTEWAPGTGRDEGGLTAALQALPDAGILPVVDAAGELLRLAEAILIRAAGEVARRSEREERPFASAAGAGSPVALLADRLRIDPPRAKQWCTLAKSTAPRSTLVGEVMPPLRPLIAAAIEKGSLSIEAAGIITGHLDRLEPHATREDLTTAEDILVTGSVNEWALPTLRAVCLALTDRLNPDGAEPRDDDLRAKAGLHVTKRPDGSTRWILDLHPEAEGFLLAALDARTAPRRRVRFSTPDQLGDPAELAADSDRRTLAQARLDALVDIAKLSLKHDSGQVAGTAVTMLITVPLETLRTGLGTAHIAGVDLPLTAKTARRLAAGANLIPQILGGNSTVLDQGDSRRLFTDKQRYALATRDGGCVFPHCTAPPGWCEAHHLTGWEALRRTDLDNAALLCSYHHHLLDREDWTITRHGGRIYATPPAWLDPTRTPIPSHTRSAA